MRPYQKAFIDFALRTEVLRFGSFELKSGRVSPYFFNTGLFDRGASLAELGRYYAEAIQASGLDFDMLYGPAYKGIPIACACAIALAEFHHRNLRYCFNRKEAKDHGEGGHTVGAPLEGKVLIVDDVISAGTSVGESMQIITAAGAVPAGVIVALDRQERGAGDLSAIQEVERRHGIDVISVIALDDLCAYLEQAPDHSEVLERIRDYRAVYGSE